MRKISVLGSPSFELKMFVLELGWALSIRSNVYCYMETEVFDRFAPEGLSESTVGRLTLIRNYEDFLKSEGDEDVFITDALFGDCDTIIYVLSQHPFSAQFFEDFVDLKISCDKVLVYLNFIDSPFDEDYFKKYQLNKKILDNVGHEEVILFDEEVRRRQLENSLNRVITLKYYPKSYKRNLYSLSNKVRGNLNMTYREFYKELDKRISIC